MAKITFVGHVSKDINKTSSETVVVPGGGVFYGSIAAERLGVQCVVVTKVSSRDVSLFKPIEEAGAELIALTSPQTTTIENVYPSDNPDERMSRVLHRADPFEATDLVHVRTNVVVVSALWHGEFPEELLKQLRQRVDMLVADAQGFLRNVLEDGRMVYHDWQDKEEHLPLIDVFKVDSNEAYIMTEEKDLERACKVLSDFGVKIVLATHKNGVVAFDGGDFYRANFSEYKMLGRTGRGDTCLASFLAALLTGKSLKEAVDLAARVTSVKMQYAGPYRGGEVV
ncbi:PfkB family carbohydrate kinase [Thermotoga caldifontis]|uniref:PfkB family carbohydrate kinase n=1 Tax=Thermotoga caldifontis TaxID=1508419 RepID=UPI000A74D297|nr:PfkB family carbohydrate kinase [Thermotoga caldifontis]